MAGMAYMRGAALPLQLLGSGCTSSSSELSSPKALTSDSTTSNPTPLPANSHTTKCDHLSPNLDASYPQFIPCLSHGKNFALLQKGQQFCQ
jgi:hypothetical protein